MACIELPLLRLDVQVIEVQAVADGLHVLMPEQLLQTERIPAQHQVAHREGGAEDVRRDPPVGEAAAALEAANDLVDAPTRERTCCAKSSPLVGRGLVKGMRASPPSEKRGIEANRSPTSPENGGSVANTSPVE